MNRLNLTTWADLRPLVDPTTGELNDDVLWGLIGRTDKLLPRNLVGAVLDVSRVGVIEDWGNELVIDASDFIEVYAHRLPSPELRALLPVTWVQLASGECFQLPSSLHQWAGSVMYPRDEETGAATKTIVYPGLTRFEHATSAAAAKGDPR